MASIGRTEIRTISKFWHDLEKNTHTDFVNDNRNKPEDFRKQIINLQVAPTVLGWSGKP